MGNTNKYDWDQIEERYVTGKESLRAIAQSMGMNFSTIGRQSSQRCWDQKRAEYRQAAVEIKIDRKKEDLAYDKDAFDDRTNRFCDIIAAYSAMTLTRKNNDLVKALEYTGPDKEARIKQADRALQAFIQKSHKWISEIQDVKYRNLGVPAPRDHSEAEGQMPFKHYQELKIQKLQEQGGLIEPTANAPFTPSPPGVITNGKKTN